MSTQVPTSDSEVLDLLRIARALSVSELSDAMEVTPTAVRQRLVRLLAQHAIQREAIRHGRGRPKHRYSLTQDGLSRTGSNFTDLPVTLSQEIRQSNDPEVRRETLRQIARTLATSYTSPIRHAKPTDRNERRIPAAILER
jgi:predicted ArsR family transcriptional regulator